jgi:anti-sigma B factor antagonist
MNVGEELDIETQGDVVIAHLHGEIDLANAKPIGSLVAEAVTNDSAGVVLDLTDVTYLDSSGVHLVFELQERLVSRQQRLVLAVPPDARIRRVLELVNVKAAVAVSESADEAVAAVRAPAVGP